MGKIIKFPNRGDKIESVKDKRTSQLKNNIFYSSLLVLFLFALVLNLNFRNTKTNSRDLANVESSQDRNLDEYILESLMSSNSGNEVIFSSAPNQEDKFLFETLMGNYNIEKTEGKINSLSLKPGFKPLPKTELAQFLMQYKRSLGLDKVTFKLSSKSSELLKYNILSEGRELGQIKVGLDNKNGIEFLKTDFN